MDIQNKVNNISKRQIALKAGVHYNTVTKFLNGQSILQIKEQKIKVAILEILEEREKIDLQISKY